MGGRAAIERLSRTPQGFLTATRGETRERRGGERVTTAKLSLSLSLKDEAEMDSSSPLRRTEWQFIGGGASGVGVGPCLVTQSFSERRGHIFQWSAVSDRWFSQNRQSANMPGL